MNSNLSQIGIKSLRASLITHNFMDTVKSWSLTSFSLQLEAMKSLIGFPSFIFNDTILTEAYSNVSIEENNCSIKN